MKSLVSKKGSATGVASGMAKNALHNYLVMPRIKAGLL